MTRVARGSFSALGTPRRLVIRSQPELEEVWAATFAAQSPMPAPPSIDFASDMVVLVAAGARPTTGYCIAVESAAARGEVVTLTVVTTFPPGGTVVAPAITAPFEIVRLPRRGDTVTFIDRTFIGHCD